VHFILFERNNMEWMLHFYLHYENKSKLQYNTKQNKTKQNKTKNSRTNDTLYSQLTITPSSTERERECKTETNNNRK